MVCSLYVPGVEYVEPDILSGVSLDQVPANKWGARVSCDYFVGGARINSDLCGGARVSRNY